MRKIRIAQIGLNECSHGKYIWQSLLKQSDLFEVVGFALPENERERMPEKVKCFDGYREMTVEEILSDPTIEAVAVETEEIYLTKYATLVAKAGKHIHMEKPGGTDLAAFEAMIQAAKESGIVFHTGYMYRYNPYVQELLEQVKNGELGEITCVEAQMNCWHKPNVRKWLETLPGGMMFWLGCHLIDLILLIQGTPKRILPLNKVSAVGGYTGEDFGFAALEYEHGWSFAKTTSVERGGFLRRQLVVCGSKATVELNPLEKYVDGELLVAGRKICTSEGWNVQEPYTECEKVDRYDSMMAAFASYVRGEKQNPFTLDYELTLYKTVLECCKKGE